jgi:hypothetical protein
MKLIARALELIGVVDKTSFLTRFVTTLGNTIYTPFTVGTPTPEFDLWSQIVVCAHEHQHVAQVQQEADLVTRYLFDPTWRATYEAQAYRVSIALEHWHRGQVPDLDPYVQAMKSYGLGEDALGFFRRYLELSLYPIQAGDLPDEAAKVAVDWLNQHAAELKAVK